MAETTEDQLEKFKNLVKGFKSTERVIALEEMYRVLEDRLISAPASSKAHYHNAFEGGYLDHILRVIECSLEFTNVLKKMGGTINFTKDEVIFAAMHHDLGKLGDLDHPLYVPETSDWHREKQGSMFSYSDGMQFMTATDRSFWLLQHFGVKYNQNEFLGIRLADGLYDECNKKYFIAHNAKHEMHSNIGYIVHWADHMATTCEKDSYFAATR
jgi:hypothetical protein